MQRVTELIQERFFTPIVSILISVLAAFCLFHYRMGALTWNHLFFSLVILVLFLAHRQSRQFLLLASPLILKDALYDSLRYVPFDWLTPIHIGDLYQLEQSLFGITCEGTPMLIHECLALKSHPFLDAVCGFSYHLLNPVVFLIFVILWRSRGEEMTGRYAVAFLVMNLMAFATYLLYPAAAPWYVTQYGFTQPVGPVMGHAAGLIQFDHLVGSDFSARLYSLNPVVFGAVPSMHAGFTMLGSLYAFRIGRPFGYCTAFYTLFMWYSALYLQHHYLIDIVWGVGYALITYALIEMWLKAPVSRVFQRLSLFLQDEETSPLPAAVYSTVNNDDESQVSKESLS